MPPRRKSSPAPSSAFAEALKFVASICKDKGSINETHCSIKNGWITAFNGTLAIGCKCDSDILASPQVKLTTEALSRCGQPIIGVANNNLSIKSDKFRAIIPCIATNLLDIPKPDKQIAVIDDRLKETLSIAGELPDESNEQIYNHSVLLDGKSVISSMSGKLIFQCWHGVDLPPALSLPKSLCAIIGKINKKLKGFGYSQWSATFYFEDDSWIRSQLYAEKWPAINVFDNLSNDLMPFPSDFWVALAAVSPFGEGMVYARDGRLFSHAQEGAGASFDLPGYQGSWCFPAKQLAFLRPWATHFWTDGAKMVAMGKNARAVIAGVRQ